MKLFKQTLLIFVLLFILMQGAWAQSRMLAIGLSAILPGSGEIVTGNPGRGAIMLTSEIVAGYSYFKTNRDISLQRDQYKKYANLYAGVPLSLPDTHYQNLQNYMSSQVYNDLQEMSARNYFLIYQYDPQAFEEYLEAYTFSDDESWEWQSEEHWKEYRKIRRKHQYSKVNNNLALGIMLLNRGISVIETALLSRNLNVRAKPSGNDGLALVYEMRF